MFKTKPSALSLSSIAFGIVLATIVEYYFTTSLIINSLIAVIFLLLSIILYQQKGKNSDPKTENSN